VYLSSVKLPVAPEGKQYQLWAIVDGKPVDAGLLDNPETFEKMKSLGNAQAFAISLEAKGGSTTEADQKAKYLYLEMYRFKVENKLSVKTSQENSCEVFV
jgi:hypothetical protein